MRRVVFKNRALDVVGHLHLPPDFDQTRRYPTLVLSTPGSSVKEQIGGIYASLLAEHGFVALTFDPTYQGESAGEPRDLESPAARTQDIHSAVDFLTTLSFVDDDRLGMLGICAGGGYAIQAALTERRFKALGTVVASDLGRAFRRMVDVEETLEAVARQRTAQAHGEPVRRDPWIPDSLKDAEEAGVADPEVLEAIAFYRESEFRHPNSTNRLLFTSYGEILGFDSFHLVPELLTLPLQVIVGGRRGATGQYEAGVLLHDLSPATDKAIFVVEGAGHYDLYYKAEPVAVAIGQLADFFSRTLSRR